MPFSNPKLSTLYTSTTLQTLAMYEYEKLYEANYAPNVRVPVLTNRMKTMLGALKNGGIVELMEAMYLIAEEDYELSDPKRMGGNKKSLRSSMGTMLEDRDSGRKDALDLLKSMHIDVIRACIDNTLGYRYKTSPEFRKLFYEVDARSGIYGYTILLEGESGEFLNSVQLQLLSKKIYSYARTDGKPDNLEAIEIDRVYGGVNFDPEPTRRGERAWITSYHTKGFANKTFILSKKLAERAMSNEEGVLPQFQSPMAVGFSKNLDSRISEHAVDSTLLNATKPWVLMLSILKVMGINISPVSIVLLKIWKDEHRALGEILITMLTSSLVDDCGYNPKQAGGNMGPNQGPEYYGLEERSVFVEKPWIEENIEDTNKELKRRLSTLSYMEGSLNERVLVQQSSVIATEDAVKATLNEDEKLLENVAVAIKGRKAQQDIAQQDVVEKTKAMQDQLEFLNALNVYY